jgi:uncharacterized membrane protein
VKTRIATILGAVAILATALFTGAAIYISLVEHSVRFSVDPIDALRQWRLSYQAAAPIQASLATIGCLAAILTALINRQFVWALAGVLIGSVIPLTLLIIMPVNQALFAFPLNAQSNEIQNMLLAWGQWHAVRSLLSLAALVLLIWLYRSQRQ